MDQGRYIWKSGIISGLPGDFHWDTGYLSSIQIMPPPDRCRFLHFSHRCYNKNPMLKWSECFQPVCPHSVSVQCSLQWMGVCASIWRDNLCAPPVARVCVSDCVCQTGCVCSLYFGMSLVWNDHMCTPAATLSKTHCCSGGSRLRQRLGPDPQQKHLAAAYAKEKCWYADIKYRACKNLTEQHDSCNTWDSYWLTAVVFEPLPILCLEENATGQCSTG